MPTIKQKEAFKNLVGNGGNVTRAMIDAKYSPNTANTPQKLTESVGFLELCEENGLTDDLLTLALVEDIKEKKGNRKGELELGFKVRGRLKDDNAKTTNNLIVIESDRTARIARRAIARLSRSEESPDRLSDSDEPEV